MKDVLIPLGLLLFIAFFVYAIIRTARNQRKSKTQVFSNFADKNDLSYQEEDNGKAQRFARDFDGIGRFSSPSKGKVIPKDVVDGIMNGSEVILFRHSIRFAEGWAREWFVVGITSTKPLAESCAVQFCKRRREKRTIYLRDPIVKEFKIGHFNLVVRASNTDNAGKMVDDYVMNQMADFAGKLSFRPEVQIRGKRVVAYLADRNATVDNVETLGNLFDFAQRVARV